jgi:hypothetical protein
MFRKIFGKKTTEEVNPDLLTELIKQDSKYLKSRKNYFEKFRKKYPPPTLRYKILGGSRYIPKWFLFEKKRHVLPFAAILIFFALTVPTTAGLEYGLPHNSTLKPSNLIIQNTKDDNIAAQPLKEQNETSEEIIIEEKKTVEELTVNEPRELNDIPENQNEKDISEEANLAQEKKLEKNQENQTNTEKKVAEIVNFCDLKIEISPAINRNNHQTKIIDLTNPKEIDLDPSVKYLSGIKIDDQKTIACYDNSANLNIEEAFLGLDDQNLLEKQRIKHEGDVAPDFLSNLYTLNQIEKRSIYYISYSEEKITIYNFYPLDLPANIQIKNNTGSS